MSNQIYIFDTTLRDGEQSPGASLNISEKVEIAIQLEKLGVDIIEAGFPVSSPAQFEAVKQVSDNVSVCVAALSRAKEIDIKKAYEAIKNAQKKRIHTFSSTSDYHILGKFADDKYGKTLNEKRDTIIKMSYEAVQYAKTFCDDIEFSAEDAGRTDINFLAEVIEAAIDAGATTVNIPDTTGYNLPTEYASIISTLRKKVKNIDKAIISVHCHNDLGLAAANSLTAIETGARQIECTVNGIGERAGNASLEEIVMALHTRNDLLNYKTNINSEEIYNTSKMVSSYTGIIVQPNKAIVGENAFAHESGIHQDGMLKNKNTYEIMSPEVVGVPNTKIVLGRHSGRHGLLARLKAIGYKPSDEELNIAYKHFTELADKKKEIYDDDLRLIMGDEVHNRNTFYELAYLHVNVGSSMIPTAVVKIKKGDKIFQDSSTGDGPVDAVVKATERAIKEEYKIESYRVRSITSGREALGEVLMRIKHDNQFYNGRGISTDIVEASAKAFINAINHFKEISKENEIITSTNTLSNVI